MAEALSNVQSSKVNMPVESGSHRTESSQSRRAPSGFTLDQWRTFRTRGILVLDEILDPRQVALLKEASRTIKSNLGSPSEAFFSLRNLVEAHPAMRCLIDHPAYIGFVYDLYGEMLKLQLSELFIRAPGRGARPERWHIDGPRVLPYAAFLPEMPMQVKVGVWLTDVLHPGMGNLAFVPGSHRSQYFDAYDTDETAPGEEQLLVRAGSITLMDTALWHRTVPNDSTVTRVNMYLGYSPSWLPTSDRNMSDPAWLASLDREQRIIMRSYGSAFSHAKPPAEDLPLFLDRDTGADRDPDRYRAHVKLLHRKRITGRERFESETAPHS